MGTRVVKINERKIFKTKAYSPFFGYWNSEFVETV